MGYARGPIGIREQREYDISRGRVGTAQMRGVTGLLGIPIVSFIIALILFGPIVITSLMSVFSFIPLNMWIVLIVVFFAYRAIK